MKLYNADCLDIMREMPDKSVDLVITDPPYGLGYERMDKTSISNAAQKKEYHYGGWDNSPPEEECFDEIKRISKNQIIFGGNYFNLPPSPCWLIWDKDNTGNFADAELAWTSFNSAIRLFKWRWNGMLQEDPNHKEIRIHPTQKPVKLFEWIIRNYAKEGDIICDPFFGSGSCLVAAVRLGHDIIGVEKEKVYFDAGKARIENERKQGKLNSWGLDEA